MKPIIDEFKRYVETDMKTTLKKEGKIIPAIFFLWPDDFVLRLTLKPDVNLSDENKRKIDETLLAFHSTPDTNASAVLFEVDTRSFKEKNAIGTLMITIKSELGFERFDYLFDRQTRTVFASEAKNNEFDVDSRFSNFFDWNWN